MIIKREELPTGLRTGDRVRFAKPSKFIPFVSSFPKAPPIETDDFIIIAENQQYFERKPVKESP